MNLYEYQAKQIFRDTGIPTPQGKVVMTESEALEAYRQQGAEVMLKAQVLTGGRGKAGGIKAACSEDEVIENVKQLKNLSVKGLPVKKILVEKKLNIQNEYYLGITLSPDEHIPVLLVSNKGGMDVEQLARDFPGALGQISLDPRYPFHNFAVRDLLLRLSFPYAVINQLVSLARSLYQIFINYNTILAEINPLVLTADEQLLAADGRLALDDNAINKCHKVKQLISGLEEENIERQLKKYGIDYVELVGDIGIISVGAGETMATMDLISNAGGRPACFLDFSGGVNPDTIFLALKTVSCRPEVKSILVNIFGGLTRIDKVAEGFIDALEKIGMIKQPLTIRLEGTNASIGRKILKSYGLETYFSLQDAVSKAVERGGVQ